MQSIYFILIACAIAIVGIVGFIFLITPTSFYDIFRIYYYRMYITEYDTVVKTVIEKQTGQNFIKYNKRAYLIPKDKLVKHKCASVFYAEIRNAMSIRIINPDTEKIIEEIKNTPRIKSKSAALNILSKLPYVNRFWLMKQNEIDEIVFANKFILNPYAILDSCTFYILMTQGFTEKIIAKPRDWMDIIADNMFIIVIGVCVIGLGAFYISSKGGM